MKITAIFVLLFLLSPLLPAQHLKVSAIGDVMAHKSLQDYVLASEDGYNVLFSQTKHIFLADDLTFANLETNVNDTLPVAGFPRFNARTALVTALKEAGVEALSLANNHSMDNGYPGLISTIEAVKKEGLIYSGIDNTLCDTRKVTIFSKKGFIIGFISITESVNGIHYVDNENSPCINFVPPHDEEKLSVYTSLIEKTKAHVDVMIVAYHGGNEYISYAIDRKKAILHKIARAGADVILAHHPHVLQPVSYLEKENGTRTLIAYSLGNFVSSQSSFFNSLGDSRIYNSKRAKTSESIILQFDVVRWNKAVKIVNPRMIPIFTVTIPVKLDNKSYRAYIPFPMEDILLEKKKSKKLLNLKVLKKLLSYRLKQIKKLIKLPVVSLFG